MCSLLEDSAVERQCTTECIAVCEVLHDGSDDVNIPGSATSNYDVDSIHCYTMVIMGETCIQGSHIQDQK